MKTRIVVIIVIVALVILGIFYFGGKPSTQSSSGVQIVPVAQVSPSDDINSIEKDLMTTDPGPDLSGLN